LLKRSAEATLPIVLGAPEKPRLLPQIGTRTSPEPRLSFGRTGRNWKWAKYYRLYFERTPARPSGPWTRHGIPQRPLGCRAARPRALPVRPTSAWVGTSVPQSGPDTITSAWRNKPPPGLFEDCRVRGSAGVPPSRHRGDCRKN